MTTQKNLSYCRFYNTVIDLRDCEEHLADELSEQEEKSRKELIEICRRIIEMEDER